MAHGQNGLTKLGAAFVAVSLLAPACASGDEGTAIGTGGGTDQTSTTEIETTTTTLPAATTTTAEPTPEDEVLAAYAGYWRAVDEAFDPPEADPESPALRQYATGDVLLGIVKSAEEAKAEGRVARIPEGARYAHRAEVVSLDQGTASVRDCNIDDTVIEDAGTGEVLDDGVSTRLYATTLVQEDGQWKVATFRREAGWEGVAGCALE